MEQQSDGQFIGILLKILRKLNKNHQCLYPGCRKKPIDSHVIAESVLERLAHKGKILRWDPHDDDIVRNALSGQELERIYEGPKPAGIRNEVNYPLFCCWHDNRVFEPLEQSGFASQPIQVVLLAYRALCYKTWNPLLEELLEFLLSSEEPEKLSEQQRLFAIKALLEARQRLEQMLETRDYTQLEREIIPLDVPPCIACTEAFIPIDEGEDTRILNGTLSLTAEDVLTFSLFPDEAPNKSICVITWFRGSRRASKHIAGLGLDKLSEDERQQMLVSTGFTHSNVFISPTWWESQSPETKQRSVKLQLAAAKTLTSLESIER